MWIEFDNIAQKYRLNFKLGHVNANSIGGFKFYEIRTWLLSGRFDILVISETKIDGSFPDSQGRTGQEGLWRGTYDLCEE